MSKVTRTCWWHKNPVWECAGCQRASVIVAHSSMTGQPMLKGVAGAPVRYNADPHQVLKYDRSEGAS